MSDTPPDNRRRRRLLAWIFGAIVLAVATHTATSGLVWSRNFHPDEEHVADWMDEVRDNAYIHSRAYPSGWFELLKIKFWLDRDADKAMRHWRQHNMQDGVVIAGKKCSFSHEYGFGGNKDRHTVQDGRNFNAYLYVIAALLFFATALEVGMRPLAAFVSAAFFLASSGPIEFLHYCETDEALVVSLAFFAWIAARAARLKSPWLAVAGCFAAGFAVSCKFTLAPTLLWCVAAPFATLARRRPSRRTLLWGVPAMLLAGVAAAYAGYALGTPAMRLAPEWYFKALREASEMTYAEIMANLGGHYSWREACVIRLASLFGEMSSYGWTALLWGLFAWTFWLRRDFRQSFSGAPMLLPIFFPFLVTLCPFVRNQETLPIAILLALGAGLPLEWWLRHGCGGLRRPARLLVPAATAAFGAAALLFCASGAAAMSDCFQKRDSRAEAQNWLYSTFPEGRTAAFDNYVGEAAVGVKCNAFFLEGLPFNWNGLPSNPRDSAPLRYYVENVGFQGRLPIRDLRTGRIRPDVRRNMADYSNSVFTLKEWCVSHSAHRPTFGQPIIRLVGLDKPDDGAIDIPIGYSRPILMLPDGDSLYDSFEAPGLGVNRAIHTVGRRSTVNLSSDHGPSWLVTRMLEGGQQAGVRLKGPTAHRKEPLPPSGAAATPIRHSSLRRRLPSASAYRAMKCGLRGDDQKLVCASFLTHSPADAARELRQSGDPLGALALLNASVPLDAPAKVEAFLAATQSGTTPDPSWIEAAKNALLACDNAAKEDSPRKGTRILLCGTPLEYTEDFARVRIRDYALIPGWRLPLYLPPGDYHVTLELTPQATSAAAPVRLPERLFPGQTSDFATTETDSGGTVMQTDISLTTGRLLTLPGEFGDGSFPIFNADIEVTWSPLRQTLAQSDTIRRALETLK